MPRAQVPRAQILIAMRLLTILMVLTALMLRPDTAHAAELRVALVYNGSQEVFQQFAEALTPQLRSQNIKLEPHDSRNWTTGEPPASLQDVDLIIAAGGDSTALLAGKPPRAAMLCVLLSRQQFEQLQPALQRSGRPLSAIYQDPPARRQIELAELLLPGMTSVGYLYQLSEAGQLPALIATAEKLNVKLVAQPVAADAELPATLVSVIGQSDMLLASANAALYNRYTIKTILTAAYRQEKVVIGSSPAFVKAGSLATTFSSVQHIAQQVSEMLQPLRSDDIRSNDARGNETRSSTVMKLPPPGYARYFDVNVNADVARSLNIHLPDNEALLRILHDLAKADEKAGVDRE
ncbi:hypothetical protein HPT27_17430 [Permianibacter sp. IMCC34836]|uniref:ABC transporter substrate-binding protein n=1 Tax=Permianibacter fluminis TaxID=2738515 RepID=UPI0015544262|nr:ABC transporter substrate binding protein [Permianibacter fluminis]NQD38801.1 hypothetical protein [Permianibacter fluminis]